MISYTCAIFSDFDLYILSRNIRGFQEHGSKQRITHFKEVCIDVLWMCLDKANPPSPSNTHLCTRNAEFLYFFCLLFLIWGVFWETFFCLFYIYKMSPFVCVFFFPDWSISEVHHVYMYRTVIDVWDFLMIMHIIMIFNNSMTAWWFSWIFKMQLNFFTAFIYNVCFLIILHTWKIMDIQ